MGPGVTAAACPRREKMARSRIWPLSIASSGHTPTALPAPRWRRKERPGAPATGYGQRTPELHHATAASASIASTSTTTRLLLLPASTPLVLPYRRRLSQRLRVGLSSDWRGPPNVEGISHTYYRILPRYYSCGRA